MDLPASLGPVILFVQCFVREPFVQIGEYSEQKSAYGKFFWDKRGAELAMEKRIHIP